MKIVLLQHLSGAKSYSLNDEIEVTDAEALRFIKKGIAKAKTPKAHNDLIVRAEKIEKEEAKRQAKIIAIQKEEELKGEADELLGELVVIVSTLGTIDEKYKTSFIEHVVNKLKGK